MMEQKLEKVLEKVIELDKHLVQIDSKILSIADKYDDLGDDNNSIKEDLKAITKELNEYHIELVRMKAAIEKNEEERKSNAKLKWFAGTSIFALCIKALWEVITK